MSIPIADDDLPKRADVEQRNLEARVGDSVRHSEQLYRMLLEQASDGIVVLDHELNCLIANARAARLFGVSVDALCQMNYKDWISAHDREHDPPRIEGDRAGSPLIRERHFVRPDGTSFLAEVSLATVTHGRLVQVSIRDVTERRRLEDEGRQAQKMEALGRLAGGVAHDFNNMLTAIIGISDMLLTQLGDTTPLARDLAEIRSAGEHAAVLTRQLLAFSRQRLFVTRPLDLNVVVRELHSMVRRLISETVAIDLQLADQPAVVHADESYLEQMVLNLAVNARDAMADGGTLTIRTAIEGAEVILTISDTGIGMDEKTRRHIFEPFFTTKSEGQGTGLGLSMVYGVVRQLRGDIRVDSAPGQGTTFRLSFPRSQTPAVPPRRVRERVPVAIPTRPCHILLVDDNSSVRSFAAKVLRRVGYDVAEATGAAEALALAHATPGGYDLVITDFAMPGMNGIELLDQIRRLRPATGGLVMSGYSGDAIHTQDEPGESIDQRSAGHPVSSGFLGSAVICSAAQW